MYSCIVAIRYHQPKLLMQLNETQLEIALKIHELINDDEFLSLLHSNKKAEWVEFMSVTSIWMKTRAN